MLTTRRKPSQTQTYPHIDRVLETRKNRVSSLESNASECCAAVRNSKTGEERVGVGCETGRGKEGREKEHRSGRLGSVGNVQQGVNAEYTSTPVDPNEEMQHLELASRRKIYTVKRFDTMKNTNAKQQSKPKRTPQNPAKQQKWIQKLCTKSTFLTLYTTPSSSSSSSDSDSSSPHKPKCLSLSLTRLHIPLITHWTTHNKSHLISTIGIHGFIDEWRKWRMVCLVLVRWWGICAGMRGNRWES